jgi:hypothetical protein
MPPTGLEPIIPTNERPQIYALGRAATGIRRHLYVGAIHFSVALHPNSDLWRRISEVTHSKTHNKDNRHTYTSAAGFELAISAVEQLQTCGFDRTTAGNTCGNLLHYTDYSRKLIYFLSACASRRYWQHFAGRRVSSCSAAFIPAVSAFAAAYELKRCCYSYKHIDGSICRQTNN